VGGRLGSEIGKLSFGGGHSRQSQRVSLADENAKQHTGKPGWAA
jgi:hypothetical protein